MAVPTPNAGRRVSLWVMPKPYPHLKSLRKLLAHLSDEDYQAAEERFWRFIETARRIERRKIAERNHRRESDSTKSSNDSRV